MLLLASSSPRRKQLLDEFGYRFDVMGSTKDEPAPVDGVDPQLFVMVSALHKCKSVMEQLGDSTHHYQLILAADTVAVHQNKIVGKARDRDHAKEILHFLQGSTHQTITGLSIWLPKTESWLSEFVSSDVRMRPLSDEQIDSYLETGLWEGKAGAYGIQDRDDPFVETIDGSYSNVMGLPMERLAELFQITASIEKFDLSELQVGAISS